MRRLPPSASSVALQRFPGVDVRGSVQSGERVAPRAELEALEGHSVGCLLAQWSESIITLPTKRIRALGMPSARRLGSSPPRVGVSRRSES